MTIILLLSLAAAAGCIVYAFNVYRKSERYHFSKASDSGSLFIYQSSPDLLCITYKGAPFIGICKWEAGDQRFSVSQVTLKLDHYSINYGDWDKNDFYQIEQAVYEKYPLTEIIWDQPMKDMMTL